MIPPTESKLTKLKFRLVGGATPHEGRVELFFRGKWGAICDDYWRKRNGHVICRQLGYKKANSVSCCSKYGIAQSGLIWLDDVRCKGTETHLLKCRYREWGHNNCNKEETAGVECFSGDITDPPPTGKYKGMFINSGGWEGDIKGGSQRLGYLSRWLGYLQHSAHGNC